MRLLLLLLTCAWGQSVARLGADDPAERDAALRAFIGTGPEALARGLASTDAEIRQRCRELARTNPWNIDALLVAGAGEELARVADGSAGPADVVRIARYGVLARPVLRSLLGEDASRPVLREALRQLGVLGEPAEDIPRLLPWLREADTGPSALYALRRLSAGLGCGPDRPTEFLAATGCEPATLLGALARTATDPRLEVQVEMWRLRAAWGVKGAEERAGALLERACAAQPGEPWRHHALAASCGRRGEPERGLAALAPLLEAPSPGTLRAAAALCFAAGRPDSARVLLERSLERAPRDAWSRHRLGLWLHRAGDSRAALAQLTRAAEDGLPLAEAFGALAWVLADAEDPAVRDGALAVSCAARALRLRPGHPELLGVLGAAQLAAGAPEEAIAPLREAERLFRARGEDDAARRELLQLARVHAARGSSGQARSLIERVRQEDPGHRWLARAEAALE